MSELQRVWVVFSDRYTDGRWELTRQPQIYASRESAKAHAIQFAKALSGGARLGRVKEKDDEGEVRLGNCSGTVGWRCVEVTP